MSRGTFDQAALLDAFDRVGEAAASKRTMLQIAVYDGSALMLASNFRYATEDVDIAEIGEVWPAWLQTEVAAIAAANGWSDDWLNDAVQFHLSPLADRVADHVEFGTFPRSGESGLRVSVPTLDYMLALKLKTMRINDPVKGPQESLDIKNLLKAGGIGSLDEAIAVMGRFFPRSARQPDAQRFFLRHIWPSNEGPTDVTPKYPG